jgi:hypothetical protein
MKNRYEQNYAAFLTFLGLDWQYEPRKFIFEKIQSGVRVFTPDFYLPHAQEFHETKGYMDRRSATQIRRLKKYYPEVTLIVVDSRFFKDAERQRLCRVIPEWVCPHTEPR